MDGSEIPGSEVDPEEERVKEIEDHIELNGVTFHKPFVEKPVSAENHNIVIYFPSGVGGGCQKLFRKIGNKSSMYSKESSIRRTGSYIYEEYLPTDGVDVKVYAVGPFYAHAEARKSPGLDGKVERDRQGKEIRYPVILSNAEKMIARRVVLAFQQNVCGFDLLRSNGKSYVCDVNGFSFVKNSVKYYDDTSNILGNMIMRRLAPSLQIPWTPHYQIEDPPLAQTTTGKLMELRCVLSVIRHGDRTPKQKMKMEVRHPRFFDLFRTYGGFKKGQLKLKRPNHLQEVLDLARELLATLNTQNEDAQLLEANGDQDPVSASLPSVSPCNEAFIHHTDSDDLKTPQVRLGPPQLVTNAISTLAIPEILDTPLGSSTLPDQSKSGSVSAHELTNYLMAVAAETDTGDGVEKNGGAKLGAPSSAADGDLQDSSRSEAIVDTGNGQCEVDEMRAKLEQIKDVLEMYGHFSGLNRKVQMKYLSFGAGAPHSGSEGTGGMGGGYYTSSNEAAKDEQREPSILLILKWGGELTPAGRIQAEELGKAFRGLYPGTGEEGDLSLGFLRLHSTYRHDLRIYASEEGRVQSTAGAFTKGLLALEGEITPILVQMVKSANTSGLLEDCQNSRRMQSTANAFLSDYLQQNIVLGPEDYARLNPTGDKSIQRSLECIRNPYEMCERIFGLICKLVASIHQRRISCQRNGSVSDTHFYVNESLILMSQRWSKLKRDFRRVKKGKVIFDISKLPDIYDNAKYCYQHNARAIQFDQIDTLYLLSKNMADVIVPLEYGISRSEKLKIGEGICTPLLEKIKLDLQQSIAGDSEEESTTKLDPRYSEDIATPMRHVRTRLYFTSKSHIHSMMNLLRYGDLLDEKDKQWRRATEFLSCVTEYNYMSQLVFMLYEDSSKEPDSDDRFHVEIHFSPGALPCIQTTDLKQLGYRSRLNNDNKSVSGLPEDDGEDNSEHHSIITTSGTTPDTPMGAKFELGEPSSVGSPMKIPEIIAENNTACEMEDHRLRSPLPHRMAGQESFDDNAMNVVGSTQDRNILVVESQSLHREEMSSADSEALKNMHLNSATIHSGYFLTPDSATGSAAQLNQDKRSASVATMEPGNKLISTAVISGKHRNSAVEPSTMVEEKPIGSNEVDEGMGSSAFDPTLENTSVVVVRKSSLPDRVSPNESSTDFAHKASDSTKTDDGSRSQHNNISEFVPPLRSLETLHNRLSYRQLAAWIDKHTEAAHCNSTSPPRSPLSRELSAFDLNPTNVTAGKTKGKENA